MSYFVFDGMRRNVLMLFAWLQANNTLPIPNTHGVRWMDESENPHPAYARWRDGGVCVCAYGFGCVYPKGGYVYTWCVVKKRKECSIAAVLGSMLPFTVGKSFGQERQRRMVKWCARIWWWCVRYSTLVRTRARGR